GIFALGTASHAYLELDLVPGPRGGDLVDTISSLREPERRWAASPWSPHTGQSAGARPRRTLLPQDSRDSTPTSSASRASSCLPPSTTRCSGSRAPRTT